jgi:glycosyltransferase involved in cell wall biosynthesis
VNDAVPNEDAPGDPARPLRVGLDVTPLLGARTGIGVFTAELVERLARRSDVEVVAWATTWRGRADLDSALPAGVRSITRPLPARPARAAWKRVNHPRIERWTGPLDVVHSPNYVVPPARAPMVTSVHDLTFLHHPEMCTADTLAYPSLLRRAARRGAWFHVDADAIADEVVELLRVPRERVFTVPLAPSPVADADPAVGRSLAGGSDYVLALGTVEPRKDLPSLVEAFDLLADHHPELRLVIAGPDGWGAAALDEALARSARRDHITRLGWVADDERAALLRGATALAYPSRYEGFGLPPLEAMSVGVPVVATSVGALPETCGDAALLVPPGDSRQLAEAIDRLVADGALRTTLIERGRRRVAAFDWDLTTDALVAQYGRIATYTAPAPERRQGHGR